MVGGLAESGHVILRRTHSTHTVARPTCTAASVVLALLLLAGCAGAGGSGAQGDRAQREPATTDQASPPKPSTVAPTGASRRALPGAGAVAFDPSRPRVAWAAGEEIRILDLVRGSESRHAVGSWVTDLGFAPDGALWVVAGGAQLWREGTVACRTDVELDRLLGIDAQGAVAAAYTHADGIGMLRHQVWFDGRCAVSSEQTDPLPAAVADAEADPGAPLRRASLRPPRMVEPASGSEPFTDLPGGARPIASSADGRWWVIEDAAGRALWPRQSRP